MQLAKKKQTRKGKRQANATTKKKKNTRADPADPTQKKYIRNSRLTQNAGNRNQSVAPFLGNALSLVGTGGASARATDQITRERKILSD